MTDIFFADLVRETSFSAGIEHFILEGASPGYRSFADAVPQNRYFYYAISNINIPREWEVGKGYIDENMHLIRDAITSSNNNDLTDFSDGLKIINLTISAQWFAAQDDVSVHSHDVADINGIGAALGNKQDVGDYALTSHGHNIGEINGLSVALDGKQDVGDYAENDHIHHINALDGADNIYFADQAIVIGYDNVDADYEIATGVSLDLSGTVLGGFGASTTAGIKDWDHVSNARSGQGYTLLSSTAANGPPNSGFWHPFNFEYFSKIGSGNITQFAIPYFGSTQYYGMRHRFSGGWSAWRNILMQDINGNYLPPDNGDSNLGSASRRFGTIYAASGIINTSDENDKYDIGSISNEWLDAWADVKWSRYKFKDGGKRWHNGLIAQQIYAAFAAHQIDAFEIGLCCLDKWDAEHECHIDEDGHILQSDTIMAPGGEKWGLRYDECFAMEAAYQRRELRRITETLAALHEAQ